jgi:hypothetical protein
LKDIDIKVTLAKIVRQMEGLNARVSQMPQVNIQVSGRLLPTMTVLQKLQSGTATQVSLVTQRCRAFESKNLNELCMMGIVTKQRRGREQFFSATAAIGQLQNTQSLLADY